MSEFKRWISYIFSYGTGGRKKNAGFAKVDARDGKCRLQVCMRGIYGGDGRKIDVGLYRWDGGRPARTSVGTLYIRGGAGEYTAVTKADNLFNAGMSLEESGGLWLTGPEPGALYLASWKGEELDGRDFAAGTPVGTAAYVSAAAVGASSGRTPGDVLSGGEERAERAATFLPEPSLSRGLSPSGLQVIDVARLPEPDLWESLCRYYPKTAPELRAKGVELLQIRPADIRYLPRRLWHFGSNSFLLHGYYHYKHLILGRIARAEKKEYILGVRGKKEQRESFSAGLFGFDHFLALGGGGPEGYWYAPITLDSEK